MEITKHTYQSLNVNELNAPKNRVAEWIEKRLHNAALQETHFRSKDTHRQSKVMEKILHANRNKKKTGVAIL